MPFDSLIGRTAETATGSAHDFAFRSIDGADLPLKDFAGHPVLVVNVASECGFTPQYKALQLLWSRMRDKGLVVIGAPSNDFGGQEPGAEAEIKAYATERFGVDFPLTEKLRVKGSQAHPFYRWAGTQAGPLGRPRWNFHKYLIGGDGRFLDWFSSLTPPDSGKIRRAIETALRQAQRA